MGKGKRNRANRKPPAAKPLVLLRTQTPVRLTSAEYRAMKKEINRQVLLADREYSDNFAAAVLWVLHIKFGFGAKRLRRFFDAYCEVHQELRKFYEFDDDNDTGFACKMNLRDFGVDIEAWNAEERKLDGK